MKFPGGFSDDGPSVAQPDPRMVCGPVISNYIFLNVCDIEAHQTGLAAHLSALPRHKIWLESTGAPLQLLSGRLHIVEPVVGAEERHARLSRDGDSFRVDLSLASEERSRILDLSAGSAGTLLTLVFDVEYAEAYESPGGYSAAYGVRYWDDVVFPVVDVDYIEFG